MSPPSYLIHANGPRPSTGDRGPFMGHSWDRVLVGDSLKPLTCGDVLDVVVELELVRVRAQPDRVDLVGALVVDPRLDQVGR